MRIYVQRMPRLATFAAVVLVAWGALYSHCRDKRGRRLAFAVVSSLLAVVAVCGILSYTVMGRMPSDEHIFVFAMNPEQGEFVREMFMNGLLYLPLGLTLSPLIGLWVIPVGLGLSAGIEYWQYYAGTGISQGTDVICNVLGCVVGAIPWLAVQLGLWEWINILGERLVAKLEKPRSV